MDNKVEFNDVITINCIDYHYNKIALTYNKYPHQQLCKNESNLIKNLPKGYNIHYEVLSSEETIELFNALFIDEGISFSDSYSLLFDTLIFYDDGTLKEKCVVVRVLTDKDGNIDHTILLITPSPVTFIGQGIISNIVKSFNEEQPKENVTKTYKSKLNIFKR